MSIQPQSQSAQLQQHHLSNDINKSTEIQTNSVGSNIITASNKTITNQQGTFHLTANNNASNLAANSNSASINSQQYCIQNTNNSSICSQTGSPMAVKQPLQQQQYQQFANQNNEMQQQQYQNNNLKYYMTNSPVSTGNQAIQQSAISSPRVVNFNNYNSGQQQQQQQHAYVLQDQQNQLNTNNNNSNPGTNSNVGLNQSNAQGMGLPNSNGQIFLNINNRIVPIQTLNLKQPISTNNSNSNNISANNQGNVIQQSGIQQNNMGIQQLQQAGGQRIQILSSVNSNNQLNSQQSSQMIQIRPNPQTTEDVVNGGLNNSNNNISTTTTNTNISSSNISGGNVITGDTNSNILNQSQYSSLQANQSQATTASNLSAEITEKMRQLENIQKQLRSYQIKIASSSNTEADSKSSTPTTYTSQQIQSALTIPEQALLQKLIIQRKTVQTEIQTLQQKLLTPNSTFTTSGSVAQANSTPKESVTNTAPVQTQPITATTNSNSNPNSTQSQTNNSTTTSSNTLVNNINPSSQPNPLTKLQLYQQVLIKLNTFKNSKTVTVPGSTEATTQQQLQLTTDEFEQLKKLLELQNQLQNELNLTTAQIQTIQTNLMNANLISKPIANQTIQIVNSSTSSTSSTSDSKKETNPISTPTSAGTTTPASVSSSANLQLNSNKSSEWSLVDKYKVLELIKTELNKLKINLNQLNIKQQQASLKGGGVSVDIVNQQQQIKERYILLVKKQSEVQMMISQHEKQAASPNPSSTTTPSSSSSQSSSSDSIAATIAAVSQQYQNPQSPQVVNFSHQASNQSHTLSSSSNIPSSQTIHIVNNTNSPKQTPIKIRNLNTISQQASPSSSQMMTNINKTTTSLVNSISSSPVVQRAAANIQQCSPGTPLRALVINNNTNNTSLTPIVTNTTVSNANAPSTPTLIPLAQVINLQKQYFSHVKFKCLSFEELAQHGVITKQTENSTIDLIKELDNRASLLVNADQISSFSKNQVKLVKKFLEQQQLLKSTIRNRFQLQILKDQKAVTEPSDLNKNEFSDRSDFLKRLMPYHILQKTEFEPSKEDHQKFDECFEKVSEKLLKKADAMKKRFHLFQLRSMQKEVESTEATLILKLYVDDLKQNLEHERQKFKLEQENIKKTEDEQKPESILSPKKSPTSFKHLILKKEDSSACNINDDFNLINQSNPLKRHLKSDDFDDDPDDFQDELSAHRTIKHHSPNFATKLLHNSINQQRSGIPSPTLNQNTAGTSFNASSSASSTTNISNDTPNITSYPKSDSHCEKNVNLIQEGDKFKMTSYVNNFLVNNHDNKKADNETNDKNHKNNPDKVDVDMGSVASGVTLNKSKRVGNEIIQKNSSDPNTSAPINISGLDELVLNEDDLAVQDILDY